MTMDDTLIRKLRTASICTRGDIDAFVYFVFFDRVAKTTISDMRVFDGVSYKIVNFCWDDGSTPNARSGFLTLNPDDMFFTYQEAKEQLILTKLSGK